MNLIRCSGKEVHFFDGDMYNICPLCGSPAFGCQNIKEHNFEEKPAKAVSIEHSFEENIEKKSDINHEIIKHQELVSLTESDLCKENQAPEQSIIVPHPVQDNNAEQDDIYVSKVYCSNNSNERYSDLKDNLVVGWLVCVKGECQGDDFELRLGRNMIGRDAGMDVVIPDASVSRDKHAVITYEPKKRTFFVQPGDGNGLVYLNDDLLMTFAELKARDIIQLGEALFMFLPFCGENFTWDAYIKK